MAHEIVIVTLDRRIITSFLCLDIPFPLLIPWVHLAFAVPGLISLASHRSNHEISLLISDLTTTTAFDVDRVCIDESLRDQGELSQDCRMPLHNMFLDTSRQPGFDGFQGVNLTNAWPSAF